MDSGKLIMNAGNIIGGYCNGASTSSGPAVYIDTNASFEMNGTSNIEGNCAFDNGAIHNCGTFIMNGGTIQKNGCVNYGAVWNLGTFTMNGGMIRNNSSTGNTSGVYADKGTINLLGGSIIGNSVKTDSKFKHAGVYIDTNVTANIGGSIIITGNTSNGQACNLYLSHTCTISIPDKLSSNALVGITLRYGTGIITNRLDADYSKYFFSDNSAYSVTYHDGHLELIEKTPDNRPYVDVIEHPIVKIVDLESLSSVQKTAVEEFLNINSLTLINILEVSKHGKSVDDSKGTVDIIIDLYLFSDIDLRNLKLWKLNEDNTLTQISFDIIDCKLVIKNGSYGRYILTV